jgi:hypothetical protein
LTRKRGVSVVHVVAVFNEDDVLAHRGGGLGLSLSRSRNGVQVGLVVEIGDVANEAIFLRNGNELFRNLFHSGQKQRFGFDSVLEL